MAKISKIKLGSSSYEISGVIHYVQSPSGTAGTKDSNRTIWTGTISEITELYTGLLVAIKVPLAGVNKGIVLNINSLGDHPVVINKDSIVTTHYPVGSILPLIYDAAESATVMVSGTDTTITGCWKIANYDANTTYSAGTAALLTEGTNTSNRVWPAKQIADYVKNGKTINTTWADLKTLRDNSKLVAGQWYRITDYVTTTAQENTQSAEHQFDIIVRADDVNVLNENAFAAKHSGDTYFTNAGTKLEAWELKYTLDNIYWSLAPSKEQITVSNVVFVYEGTEEINSTTYYRWSRRNAASVKRYTLGKSVGDTVYYILGTSLMTAGTIASYAPSSGPSGSGTIYWMKDEFDNECPYDFKNIQFKRWKATDSRGRSDINNKYMSYTSYGEPLSYISVPDASDYIWTFTFSSNSSGGSQTDMSLGGSVYKNVFCKRDSNELLNNVIYGESSGNTFGLNCYDNTFGNYSENNSIGCGAYKNFIGAGFRSNIIGDDFCQNSVGNSMLRNIIGHNAKQNIIEDDCFENIIGNGSSNNIIGNNFSNNTIGNNSSVTAGNYFRNNSVGNNSSVTAGNYFQRNSVKDICSSIKIQKDYVQYVIIETGNKKITLTSTQTTSSSFFLQNIKICQGVNNTNTTKTISHDTVGDTFLTEYKPINSQVISV